MNIVWIFSDVMPSLVYAYIGYRFLIRTLHHRFKQKHTFILFLLFEFLYGQANIKFKIVGTVIGNNLYYCIGFFLLYVILFHGNLIKIAFFAVMLQCSYAELSHLFLPLLKIQTQLVQIILPYIELLLFGLLFEWLGRKFQNLRFDLPQELAAFLLFVTLFVFTSTATITELSMMANEYYKLPLPLSLLYNLFAIFGTLIITFAVFTIDKQISYRLSEQNLAIQIISLKEKEEHWHQLASFKHDIKNHLSCLKNLIENDKNDKALSYLDTLTNTMQQINNQISTGNEFADAIINEKYAVMTEKKITFIEDICIPDKCPLEPVELCCIFSNILDNAINACEQISDADKWIKAYAFTRQSQLVIVVENSIERYNNDIMSKKLRYKEGIGLSNVRHTIEKYNGVMDISTNKTFIFSVMLSLD